MKKRLSVEEVRITPAIAQKYRTDYAFEYQRIISWGHVQKVSEYMTMDKFMPEFCIVCLCRIKGTSTWKLLNGNHTMESVQLSGKEYIFRVEYWECDTLEEQKEMYFAFDGKQKTFKNQLHSLGLAEELGIAAKHVELLGSAMKFIDLSTHSLETGPRTGMNIYEVADGIRAWIGEYKMLLDIVNGYTERHYNTELHKKVKTNMLRQSTIPAAIIALRYAPTEALKFWTAVRLNDGLPAASIEKFTFDFISESKHAYHATSSLEKIYSPQQIVRYLSQIWNSYVENTPRPTLTIHQKEKEEFKNVPFITVDMNLALTPFSVRLSVPVTSKIAKRAEKQQRASNKVEKKVVSPLLNIEKVKEKVAKFPGLLEKLGKISDTKLSQMFPLSHGTIWNYRLALGIPSCTEQENVCKTKAA